MNLDGEFFLVEMFGKATRYVRENADTIDKNLLLRLYGAYKQVCMILVLTEIIVWTVWIAYMTWPLGFTLVN